MKKIQAIVLGTLSVIVLTGSYYSSLQHGPTQPSPTAAASVSAPAATTAPTPTVPAPTSPAPTTAAPAPSQSAAASPAPAANSTGLADGSYTGNTVSTAYGDVQVQITVAGGTISDVQVPVHPDQGGRTQQINSIAVPQLVQETLSAQSANITMVSGATYTSTGYLTSLQSAIDQASA